MCCWKKFSFIKLNKCPLNFISINLEAWVWKSQPACKVLRGKNISPFLHRWGVKTILTTQRYTLLKFYFKKQKPNFFPFKKLSQFLLWIRWAFKAVPLSCQGNVLDSFGLNFNQLSNVPPAISTLDLVIIFSARNLVSLQKVSSCLFASGLPGKK